MRVDGSIKSVTAGVTTLDDKRHSGVYAKKVDNFRCDPDRGLTKRPPLIFTAFLDDRYVEGRDAVFPFTLGNTDYWCVIYPEHPDFDGNHRVLVYTVDGTFLEVSHPQPSSYFNGITGTTDIAFVAIGDALYIANKSRDVLQSSLLGNRTRNSMVVLKQAPAPLSRLEVTWTGSDFNQKRVVLDVPEETVDTGTNTMAAQLAVLMAAQSATNDIIYVKGATISINRNDNEYASVSCTDGANDAVMASLNDETQDINNLPKYAPHESVVKVRPDKGSDRGQFWMRATAYVEADETPLNYQDKKDNLQLVEDSVLTMGYNDWLGLGALYLWGYQRFATPDPGFNAFGNLVPNLILGATVDFFGWMISGNGEAAHLLVQVNTVVSNPNDFNYCLIADTVTGDTIYASQIVPYDDNKSWAGIQGINAPYPFVEGRTYDIYYSLDEEYYGALPEVVWQEAANPEIRNFIDGSTMPHVLGLNSAGTFVTGPMGEMGIKDVQTLRPRLAGDNDTNQMPAFVDHTINDLGRFQDRLVILSGESVTMSLTDKPHAWFRETVTQQLSTDPIGLKSGAQDAATLDYIVNHNNDALLFSKTAQYKLLGAVGMTSQNAALTQTTTYDNTGTTKPTSNGSDVFFNTAYNDIFTGVSRFSIDKDADSQDIAVSVTNHVQAYIPGNFRDLKASTSLNVVLGRTDLAGHVLFVFEYRDMKNDAQAAWSRWILPEQVDIRSIMLRNNHIRLAASMGGDGLYLATLSLNQINIPGFQDLYYLDVMGIQPNTNLTVDITDYPWIDDSIFMYQGQGCPNPGDEITEWVQAGNTVTLSEDMEGGTVFYGYPFRAEYMPSRRWIRDDSGTPQTASKLRITDYGFHAFGEEINVDVLDGPEAWPTQVFTANDPFEDKYHRVSFKQRHDEADINIWSDHHLRTEILQIEWRGTYFKTGRRF